MATTYPVKRVFRNWKLFTALLIGIALAATFFACIDIKANLAAEDSLNQQLKSVDPDMQFSVYVNQTEYNQVLGNVSSINGVQNVTPIARYYEPAKDVDTNYSSYLEIVSFPNSSSICNDWNNMPSSDLGANQTYVVLGTQFASHAKIGDNVTTELAFPTPNQGNWTTVYLNLTIAGFADLTDEGYQLVQGGGYYGDVGTVIQGLPSTSDEIYNVRSEDVLIVGWNSTLYQIWSTMANRTVNTSFMINVDRAKLISPWNIPASISNVNNVYSDVQNKVLSKYQSLGGLVSNNLVYTLQDFNDNFQAIIVEFVVLSIPIFIVAWYLGSTVADVSFNLRRREIGLLSTKGLSSGQIQRMFLGEAVTVGLIGGVAGVIGGLILNQAFVGKFDPGTLFNSQLFNPYTMAFTVVFGIAIGLASMFWSARKASRIPTVEALREYVDSSNQPYHKVLPWIIAAIGAYEIIVLLLGINVQMAIQNYSSSEFILAALQQPLIYINEFLIFFGPLFFFWGISKLLIQNYPVLQWITSQCSRVMGDFGKLAAKNIVRNPARVVAIAFLIAFIVGYGVQVSGQTASQQDYLVRQVQFNVGADISVAVSNASQAQATLNNILANVTGIQSSTMVCQLEQPQTGTYIKTVDPNTFLATAYYESDWFTGGSVQKLFNELKSDNSTIILDRRIAEEQNLTVGDTVAINFPSGARTLTIIGLFGPQIPKSQLQVINTGPGGSQFQYINVYGNEEYWSYVPRNLFNMTVGSDAYQDESFDTTILLKLNPGVNGTAVADKIRSINTNIIGVTSFAEQWQQTQNSEDQSTFYTLQVLSFQNLSIVFAVLSASLGMVVIAVVSLSERSREATLMSVRGVSYGQLVWMLLAENLAVITFGAVLGVAVGYVIDRGTILAANVGTQSLVYPHVVFPTSAVVTIACYIGLIYASTIAAVLVVSRRYVTKLERMVRTK